VSYLELLEEEEVQQLFSLPKEQLVEIIAILKEQSKKQLEQLSLAQDRITKLQQELSNLRKIPVIKTKEKVPAEKQELSEDEFDKLLKKGAIQYWLKHGASD